jgi:uncharacterized membrane protein
MVFCGNCGTQVQDGVKFCPKCGAVIDSAPPQPQYQQLAQQYQPPVVPGAPVQTDIQDAQDNKEMAILAYIIFFIPLLAGAHKTSPFAKYHANQGTVLFLTVLAWSIVYGILTAIVTAVLFNPATWYNGGWGVLGVITTILSLLWLIPTVLAVIGIVNAATGKIKPLPVIGKFTIIK